MIKKELATLILAIFFISLVTAQSYKINIEIKDNFKAGEKIVFKVSLFDSANNPINKNIDIMIQDIEKKNKIEQQIESNKFVEIDLGKTAQYGIWTITASYQGEETTSSFTIEANELAEFNLNGDELIITNIGNTRYEKKIQILIGETVGTKEISLAIGEKTSLRLTGEGVYNIKITDGTTTFEKSNVKLTGNVVGVLDKNLPQAGPVTGLRPEDEESDFGFSNLKNKTFVYVFLIMVIGAVILLAIERRYRHQVQK